MKKVLVSFISTLLLLSIFLGSTYASSQPIKVFKDGKELVFDVNPVIENGTTLVEFRTFFDSLGMSVGYNSETKLVTGQKDGLKVELVIGSKTAIVNGKLVNLDIPAKTYNGRTLVPLRFVSESTGADVKWDGSSRTITIEGETKNTRSPIQSDVPSKSDLLTIKDMESNGFIIDTSERLSIIKGEKEYKFSKSTYLHLLETGRSLNSENYTTFNVYYIDGEFLFEKSIIDAFSIY